MRLARLQLRSLHPLPIRFLLVAVLGASACQTFSIKELGEPCPGALEVCSVELVCSARKVCERACYCGDAGSICQPPYLLSGPLVGCTRGATCVSNTVDGHGRCLVQCSMDAGCPAGQGACRAVPGMSDLFLCLGDGIIGPPPDLLPPPADADLAVPADGSLSD